MVKCHFFDFRCGETLSCNLRGVVFLKEPIAAINIAKFVCDTKTQFASDFAQVGYLSCENTQITMYTTRNQYGPDVHPCRELFEAASKFPHSRSFWTMLALWTKVLQRMSRVCGMFVFCKCVYNNARFSPHRYLLYGDVPIPHLDGGSTSSWL